MLGLIFAAKFLHIVAAAVLFGGWLTVALFMLLAHRSHNTSVVALVSRFAVSLERTVMAAAIVAQPLTGLGLAFAVGASPLGEFWIVASLVLYAAVVVAWLAVLRIETSIRDLSREAALDAVPLPATYDRLFRLYSIIVWPALAVLAFLFALMVWQPRL